MIDQIMQNLDGNQTLENYRRGKVGDAFIMFSSHGASRTDFPAQQEFRSHVAFCVPCFVQSGTINI